MYGLINKKGKEVSPFVKDELFFDDETNKLHREFKNNKYKGHSLYGSYQVNINLENDINDFNIRDYYVPRDANKLSEVQKLILKADSMVFERDYLKAIEFCDDAIKLDSLNPGLYYSSSYILTNEIQHLFYNDELRKNSFLLNKIENYINKALQLVDTSDKFEYKLILIERYKFYNELKNNNREKQKTKKVLTKDLNNTYEYDCKSILLAFNNSTYNSIELGYGYGSYFENGLINANYFIGFSFEKGISKNINALRLYLLDIHYLLDLGIYPSLYMKNYDMAFGIKTEIGTTFGRVSITYGYTIISKRTIPEVRTHSLNLKYFIPLKKERVFIDK